MKAEGEDYGPTYRYFRSNLQIEYQHLIQQRQWHLEWLRGRITIISGYLADSNGRSKYPSYEAALADFLEKIKPDDDFRDEAVQIFQQVWEQSDS